MKKELNGKELALYIKERQAKAVRGLKQQWKVEPKLAIIRTNPEPVVDTYMRIKQQYGDDIGIAVDVHSIQQIEAVECIRRLNDDPAVHGIIVQLPLPDTSQTDKILNTVRKAKDVDGLVDNSTFGAPTAVAITWLLAGYDINLLGKKIVIVGKGRLVGEPLAVMFESSGYDVTVADRQTDDLAGLTRQADVLVSATGVGGIITPEMVKPDAIVVDAGLSTDSNGLVGDVADAVRELPDISITPIIGGVGSLTVSVLFENVITAARIAAKS